MIGLVGFAVASAIGGAANGFAMLVIARAAQGAFGALLAPAILSLLSTTFTETKERAKAFAIFGAVAGTGGAVGLLLGGVLTEYLSWRWCLYVNLVMAAITVVGALVLLPRYSADAERPKLDIPGSITVTARPGRHRLRAGPRRVRRLEQPGHRRAADRFGVVALARVRAHRVAGGEPAAAAAGRPRPHPRRCVPRASRISGAGMFAVFLFLSYFMSQIAGLQPGRHRSRLPADDLRDDDHDRRRIGADPAARVGPRPLMTVGMLVGAGGMFYLGQLQVGSGYGGGVLPGLVIVGVGMGLVFAPAINTSTAGRAAGGFRRRLRHGQRRPADRRLDRHRAAVARWPPTPRAATCSGKVPTLAAAAQASLRSYTTAFTAAAFIFLLGAVVTGLLVKRGPLPEVDSEAAPAFA